MMTTSRNISHTKFVCAQEIQSFTKKGNLATNISSKFIVNSNLGWGMTYHAEKLGISKVKEKLANSKKGLLFVLESLKTQKSV